MEKELLYLVVNDGEGFLLLAVGAIAVFAWLKSSSLPQGDLNLSSLQDGYGSDAVNRLNQLYAAMLNNGWTTQQCLYGLSQILHESGLFTSLANYNLMDNYHNYAGLTSISGGYASYNSIPDFVNDYENFLTKGANPLGASNLMDFNNRLVTNHYYTDSPQTYYNDLSNYYNLLVSTITNG